MNSNGSLIQVSSSLSSSRPSSTKGRSHESIVNNSRSRSTLRFAITANTTANIDIDRGIQIAEALRRNGRYAQAIKILDQTLLIAVAIHRNKYNSVYVQILWQVARTHHVAGNLHEAMHYFEDVLGISRHLMKHEIIADCLFRLGHMKQYMGDFASAEVYYHEALRVAIFIHGTSFHMDIATIIFNMGMLAHGWGCLDTAQAMYEEAIAIARTLCPESNANFIRDGLELLSEVVLRRGAPVGLELDDDDDNDSDDDDDETFNEPMARTMVNYRYLESVAFARLVAVCRLRVEIDEKSCASAA